MAAWCVYVHVYVRVWGGVWRCVCVVRGPWCIRLRRPCDTGCVSVVHAEHDARMVAGVSVHRLRQASARDDKN